MHDAVSPSQVDPPTDDILAHSVTWADVRRNLGLLQQCLIALEITLAAFAFEMRQMDSPEVYDKPPQVFSHSIF